jgi:outer membrane receptor protein involved in Fe transport
MIKIFTRTLFAAVIFSLMFSPSYAQKWGKITGIVLNSKTGEPLAGANIMIEGTLLGAAADLNGRYFILRVPPGNYDVSANVIGYQKVVVRDVEVLTDLTTEVNFRLGSVILELGEEIVVVAERPIIRKDLTSSENRVQSEEIDRMAVQELDNLLDLQAGIIRDAQGEIHIRGGRSSEVSYTINGISVMDDYTRTQALQVENESIQELQIISGTFNAEYGNAMSGIINIVTKRGSNTFRGNLEGWIGDYFSATDDIFWNINDLDMRSNYSFRGALDGPIIKDRLTFFMTGRLWNNDGWIFGPNAYLPQGRSQNIDDNIVQVRGDSSAVSMNYRKRWSGQASLEWRLSTPFKLRIDVLTSNENKRNYHHDFRLNPNGDYGYRQDGITAITNFVHVIGKNLFYELTCAYKNNRLISRLYEDPFDSRYIHPDSLDRGAFQFVRAGTDLNRFERFSRSWIGKLDLTSQLTNRHQIKTGIEFQTDRIFFDDVTLVPAEDLSGEQIQPFQPEIRDPSTPVHDLFTRRPFKFAAYVQDKIEYESLIINVGLRYDLFDANGRIPVDLEDPNIYYPFKLNHIYKDTNNDGIIGLDEQRDKNMFTMEDKESFWYRNSRIKTQLSPRLGVAYPITDRGVIHFSYGIFQQVPEYSQLYLGDQLKIKSSSTIQGPFGNPDLKPECTTMFELGLRQQVFENLAIDITGYYRDIRNWISTGPPISTALASVLYKRKINRDFAHVLGMTLMLHRRLANHFSFNIDYTFQIAEGTNSTPEEEFFSQKYGAEPTRQLTPLSWDQRHALNINLFLGSENWGFNLLSHFNSGHPYTPSLVTGTRVGRNIMSGLEKNSRRKPNRFIVDCYVFKNVSVRSLDFQLFVRIFNLFNAKSPIDVYGDTGEADFTLLEGHAEQADPTWFIRPDFYSEPRQIQIGTELSF